MPSSTTFSSLGKEFFLPVAVWLEMVLGNVASAALEHRPRSIFCKNLAIHVF
jgi:hypothetical protein